MSDPQSIQNETISSSPITDPEVINTSLHTELVNDNGSSLPIKIAKTTGYIALYALTSSIARRAIFAGTLYLAGGTILSTVGLTPVMIAGALVCIL